MSSWGEVYVTEDEGSGSSDDEEDGDGSWGAENELRYTYCRYEDKYDGRLLAIIQTLHF